MAYQPTTPTSLFIVILRYLVDRPLIDAVREEHLTFLKKYYAQGIFMASGRQKPITGGAILAHCESRSTLSTILKEDPFYQHNLAEYQIFEFEPSLFSADFKTFLDTLID